MGGEVEDDYRPIEYWGEVYTTEAAQAALKVGFARLELSEIGLFTAIDHHRSRTQRSCPNSPISWFDYRSMITFDSSDRSRCKICEAPSISICAGVCISSGRLSKNGSILTQ